MGRAARDKRGRLSLGTWYRLEERRELVGELEAYWLAGSTQVRCTRCGCTWPVEQLRVELGRGADRQWEWYVMCADPGCKGGGPGVELIGQRGSVFEDEDVLVFMGGGRFN